MNLEQLAARLRKSWSRETTSDPLAWSTQNPAWGQCAVTACVVQDHLGGRIVWSNALLPNGRRASHYFNEIDGEVVDLTRGQFPEGTVVPPGQDKTGEHASTRDYVLSFAQTRKRYDALVVAVSAS